MEKQKKVRVQFGTRMLTVLDKIAFERFGEFGFDTLDGEDKMAAIELAMQGEPKKSKVMPTNRRIIYEPMANY